MIALKSSKTREPRCAWKSGVNGGRIDLVALCFLSPSPSIFFFFFKFCMCSSKARIRKYHADDCVDIFKAL